MPENMDPPTEQQTEADRVTIKGEAAAYLFQMAQTIACFDTFCNDMQAAVNESSHYDVRRYLDVTNTCDYLRDCMKTATNLSALFIYRHQGRPDRIQNHISRMMEQVSELRERRNRITELYLMGMVCEDPKPWELEEGLTLHMSMLREDMQRILNITEADLSIGDYQAGADDPSSSQLASQEG